MAKTLIRFGGEAAVKTSLSPAQAGSRNWEHIGNPRLKAGGYGSYAGFADGMSRDDEGRIRRMPRRSAAGPAAGPPAARWRVANSTSPPSRRRSSQRAAGATALT